MKYRREFLRQTALFNAVGAAFQRATIYAEAADAAAKGKLKRDLEQRLRRIENKYRRSVSSEKHLRTIARLAREMSRRYARVLRGGRFRVGTAQKAVNIYLKLLWCYGWIPEPPHCPIDSIVLREIGDTRTRWTKMDDIAAYSAAIEAIRAYIRRAGSAPSLSQWELQVWNARRDQGVRQTESSHGSR